MLLNAVIILLSVIEKYNYLTLAFLRKIKERCLKIINDDNISMKRRLKVIFETERKRQENMLRAEIKTLDRDIELLREFKKQAIIQHKNTLKRKPWWLNNKY